MSKTTEEEEVAFRDARSRSRRQTQTFLLVPEEELGRRARASVGAVYVWNVLWSGKYLILATTLIFAALSVAYALTATQWYRAEVVLVPPAMGSEHGLASRLGGLIGAGGLIDSLGIGVDSSDVEALAVLGSSGFARDFIREQNLLPVLFAKDWDAAAGRWRSADPSRRPDLDDGVAFFEKSIRKVRDDKKTGIVRLAMEWTDPKLAATWANLFVERLNDRMRERALATSEDNIKYLRQAMATENTVILQQSIGHVLEGELQKEMLARGNREFSFTVVDRAEPPKWRVRPKRTVIVAVAVVLGMLCGAAIVLLRRMGPIFKDLERLQQGGLPAA